MEGQRFTRSTPLGVTSVDTACAGTDAGSAATLADGNFGRTLRAKAKLLMILYVVNPTTERDLGRGTGRWARRMPVRRMYLRPPVVHVDGF